MKTFTKYLQILLTVSLLGLSQLALAQEQTWKELNQKAIAAYEEGNFMRSLCRLHNNPLLM